jgi:RNA 3'-terminal phosphate cyclase (ATP)
MIEIDGSQKSGSGTIVRDCVPFAILAGRDIRITNIRARRNKPGLRRQHLMALQACAQISGGHLQGASVGAQEIIFRPGNVIRGGIYNWDIGSAGSATMLAMAVLPLGLFADNPSTYTITGGLFQDFAPTVFHFKHVLLPVLNSLGAKINCEIIRPGYVPHGKGQLKLDIEPLEHKLEPLKQLDQGQIIEIKGMALSSLLTERQVSDRMANSCQKTLHAAGYDADIDILYDTREQPVYKRVSTQPGAALALVAKTNTGCLIGADMAGARGRSSEFIGKKTARNLLEDLHSGATVDRYLADQLIPYAALATGTSSTVIPKMTDHIESRLWLIETILGAEKTLKKRRLVITNAL